MADRHDQDPMLPLFTLYSEDRRKEGDLTRLFANFAHTLCSMMPASSQRSVGLQRLLEARDAMVRAWLLENPTRLLSDRYPTIPLASESVSADSSERKP